MDNQHKKPLDLAGINAKLAESRGPQYWRSLEELAETPEFQQILEDEFPQQARPLQMPVDRRQFLMLAGASLALAGLSGCRYLPQKKIVPYVDKPEGMEYGIPMFYATAVTLSGVATGVLVTSREGRPVKIEGNPDHPASRGAADSMTQATLLTMYDPDRSQSVLKLGEVSSWEAFLTDARKALTTSKGAGLRILTETVTSPTLAAQMEALKGQFPDAKWHQYEPCGRDNAREGAKLAFGSPVNTIYHFDKADRILSLDSDFMLSMPGNLRYARDFIDKRRVRTKEVARPELPQWSQPANDKMNRLYVVESTATITGAMADHRLPVRASQIEAVARILLAKLDGTGGGATLPAGVSEAWLDAVVKDLNENKGTSLVVTGDHQSPAVHALVHAINAKLEGVSKTVTYTDPIEVNPENQLESLKTLLADIKSGQVKMLFILGGNPVYTAPADLEFSSAINSVPLRVHLSMYDDETSARCHWQLPETHSLEAWSDARAYDGTISIVQPLIAPLFSDSKSIHEFLSAFLPPQGEKSAASGGGQSVTGVQSEDLQLGPMQAGYDIVHGFWSGQNSASNKTLWPELNNVSEMEFEKLFQKALHDGLLHGSALSDKPVTANAANIPPAPATVAQGPEILFLPDPTVYDGRFCNNGWLQELPKPITKLTWDNAALLSPQTAINLKLAPQGNPEEASEKRVKLTVGSREVTAAVLVVPGLPDDCVTLSLGYGRERAGRLGTGTGFNAYALRTSEALHIAHGAKLEAADGTYLLAHTRSAHSIEAEPHEMVNVQTLAEFEKNKEKQAELNAESKQPKEIDSSKHEVELQGKEKDHYNPRPNESLYGDAQETDHKYEGFGAYAWGMSIDNNACIGCNACVTACQSENNISIVGKDQIRRGRDMLWLRIDTYYRGPINNPQSFFEPVPCMHCELAPCEPVCPVAATVHSHEGLNMQIYNRCVGTKYCSNNCPYKVRRFNFYKYAAGQPEPDKVTANYDSPIIKLSANPEVTIRGRGIMEKCTYCVQRINSARIEAKKERREIKDGEILTACQQSCPTNAIVFGNISDKKSLVSLLKTEPHDYTLLADLNTHPRTTYLARLRNPNLDIQEPGEAPQSDKKTE